MVHARIRMSLAAGALALLAVGCGDASGGYCTALTDQSDVSATLFAPVSPGLVTAEEVQKRLDLMDLVDKDVPEDLREDFDTWRDYLTVIEPLVESQDPAELRTLVEAGQPSEVKNARDRLFEHYTGTCMD